MPPREASWKEIPEVDRKRFQPFVDYFIPAVRLKPLDLWVNFRARHRIAVPGRESHHPRINRIRLAVHYRWDAPSESMLRSMRPGWSSFAIERWLERFERHEERWGPGDVELVTVTIERRPEGGDGKGLYPWLFSIDEIGYRTGAHARGVLKQAWEGDWDKLGNRRVRYRFREAPFESMDKRPVLTVDSYHHSFFEPGRVPARALRWLSVVIPRSTYFSKEEWEYFRIDERGRGSEAWQAA